MWAHVKVCFMSCFTCHVVGVHDSKKVLISVWDFLAQPLSQFNFFTYQNGPSFLCFIQISLPMHVLTIPSWGHFLLFFFSRFLGSLLLHCMSCYFWISRSLPWAAQSGGKLKRNGVQKGLQLFCYTFFSLSGDLCVFGTLKNWENALTQDFFAHFLRPLAIIPWRDLFWPFSKAFFTSLFAHPNQTQTILCSTRIVNPLNAKLEAIFWRI